ncbi:Histone deacetylase domain protein [uncultured archaeon]|nr:Histone deacetylase domain protein [uncultured archaeon]
MKIIYSTKYEECYPTNPVENSERVRHPAMELKEAGYEFVEPTAASDEDVARVHGREHIERVKQRGLYEVAALAAGGAIVAAEQALQGEPTFALIRPPGHHAAANRAWGMCFFNNMAISVRRLRPEAKRVLIIDIDLHFGDGTVSIFRGDKNVKLVNPWSVDANFEYLNMKVDGYLTQVNDAFNDFECDIVGVSAGFDTYVEDWGGLLRTEDYEEIGRIIKKGSETCDGRRFAVLEGGYHQDLRYIIKSFIRGFE